MKRTIELKHVEPRAHVQRLLEELLDRLEEKFDPRHHDSVSAHIVFEENAARRLYRTSLTCHVPGHTLAAHEERREPGTSIRETFKELERQLEKHKTLLDSARHRPGRVGIIGVSAALWLSMSVSQAAEQAEPLSPKAVEALQLMESHDPYQRQLGFLRLEALREPAALDAVKRYLHHNDPEMRAYAVRALAAIQGAPAVPALLQYLQQDKRGRVRRAALLALEPFQPTDPALLPAFIKALRDRDTEVRIAATDVVSRIDDPRAREAILIRMKRERRTDVRRVLGVAVKRVQP